MSGKPLASIVIPTCNRVEELHNLLVSATAQTVPVEIHVMDDGANDATAEMIHRDFPKVRYHRLGTNRGPAFQRNRGIELASNNIVFPIDDDSLFVSQHTVEQTLAEFGHPRVGAVGIPYINIRQDNVIRQRAPEDEGIHVAAAFVGAAHAIKRDVFLKIGGFREHFFYMGEEGDLCVRMLSQGYVTRLGCADPIHHLESPRRDFSRMDFYGRRNDVLFAWHNVPMPYLPVHLIGTSLNGLRLGLKLGRSFGMLRGLVSGYGFCLQYWRGRRPVSGQIYRLYRELRKGRRKRFAEVESHLPTLLVASSPSEQLGVRT
jgi:GT2 family glycosyltransferase